MSDTAQAVVSSTQAQPALRASLEAAIHQYLEQMGEQDGANLYELVLSEIEEPLLRAVMKHTKNNQSKTARLLGLNRGTLRKKLKKYDML